MNDVLNLCYHSVSREWEAGFSVRPHQLEKQVATLLRRGYVGATFHDATMNPPAARTLAITFDDAYRSVFELARPVLQDLGVPATVFVPTSLVDSEAPMCWPGIDHWIGGPHENELIPMSWRELGTLASEGWEIASHTRTHARLPSLSSREMRDELEGSRRDCEERIGTPCHSLAYPFGDFDARVIDDTRAAGYSAAGALTGRVRNPTNLSAPRVGIYRKDRGPRFELKASSTVRRLRGTRAWQLRFLFRRPG